jgi:hypothetical protein
LPPVQSMRIQSQLSFSICRIAMSVRMSQAIIELIQNRICDRREGKGEARAVPSHFGQPNLRCKTWAREQEIRRTANPTRVAMEELQLHLKEVRVSHAEQGSEQVEARQGLTI